MPRQKTQRQREAIDQNGPRCLEGRPNRKAHLWYAPDKVRDCDREIGETYTKRCRRCGEEKTATRVK